MSGEYEKHSGNAANNDTISSQAASPSIDLDSDTLLRHNDRIAAAASEFEAQINSLTTWKHQLAQQMELLRRDGLKLLEKQKRLAEEKHQITAEREKLKAERDQLQLAHDEVSAQARKVEEQAKELHQLEEKRELARADMEQAEAMLAQIRDAQTDLREQQRSYEESAQSLEAKQAELAEQTAAAEKVKADLDARQTELAAQLAQVQQREAAMEEQRRKIDEQRVAVEASRAAIEGKAGELEKQLEQARAAMEETYKTQLAQAAAENEKKLAEKIAQLESERKNVEAQLAQQGAELTKKQVEDAKREVERQYQAKITELRAEYNRKMDQREEEIGQQMMLMGREAQRLQERRRELEAEATEIREQLSRASTEQSGSAEALISLRAQHETQIAELSSKLEIARLDAESLQTEKARLEQQLASAANEMQLRVKSSAGDTSAKQAEMAAEISKLQLSITELTESKGEVEDKLAAALAEIQSIKQGAAGLETDAQKQAEEKSRLEGRISVLEAAKREVEAQLKTAQDEAEKTRKQHEDYIHESADELERQIAEQRGHFENKITDLTAQLEKTKNDLASEREAHARLAAEKNVASGKHVENEARLTGIRRRLTRQIMQLRQRRQQWRGMIAKFESNAQELQKQKEQFATRKENLDQVKRLLEKQELVLSRKLADHSAMRTVGIVSIAVAAILFTVFSGVYHFVKPVWRSEAIVQVTPPASLHEKDVAGWLAKQEETLRSPDVIAIAWQGLRQDGYGGHDNRDAFVASLAAQLKVTPDVGSKQLSVQYTGGEAKDAADICNALSGGYSVLLAKQADKVAPDATDTEKAKATASAAKATIFAKATPAQIPIKDDRRNLALMIAGSTMIVAAVFGLIIRFFIRRSLREIEKMSDEGSPDA